MIFALLVSLADAKEIRGKVTKDGKGVGGVFVSAHDTENRKSTGVFTAADGTYAIDGLREKDYRVRARLKGLNEIDGIDIDTGSLEAIDDGFVEYNGTWSVRGDNLELHFETMKIEVGGEVPITKKRLAVTVHEEDLSSAGENQLVYSYRFANGKLLLNGESLTLGISLAETAPAAGMDPLAVETLGLIGEFIRDQIGARDEDEFAMTRIE